MESGREEFRNLFRAMVLSRIDGSVEMDDEALRLMIEQSIRDYVRTEHRLTVSERRQAKKDVFDSLRRLDVIQDLMEDPDVTEIMVNGPDRIFFERDGGLYESGRHFFDRKRLEDVIQKIASGVNRVINEANPIVDARLQDGSRVNV